MMSVRNLYLPIMYLVTISVILFLLNTSGNSRIPFLFGELLIVCTYTMIALQK